MTWRWLDDVPSGSVGNAMVRLGYVKTSEAQWWAAAMRRHRRGRVRQLLAERVAAECRRRLATTRSRVET